MDVLSKWKSDRNGRMICTIFGMRRRPKKNLHLLELKLKLSHLWEPSHERSCLEYLFSI